MVAERMRVSYWLPLFARKWLLACDAAPGKIPAMPDTRIGISGWRYGPWRGTFYPKELAQRRELEYASRQLNSIEINGTFYSLQRPNNFIEWYEQTPDDFVFTVKGGRFITHMKKLKDVAVPLANFFAQGVLALREKLGPILWQFPPGFAFNEERFQEFFSLLPRDTGAASEMATRHDQRLSGRSFTKTDKSRPLRHAVEVRHPSFLDPAFIKLLRRHNVALVLADTAGKWPYAEDVTADFIYARLHGDKELYVSGYDGPALDWWAARLDAWRKGGEPADAKRVVDQKGKKRKSRDVFVYFDNDVKIRAPFDAAALAARLGVATPGARQMIEQPPEFKGVTAVARERWPGMGRRRQLQTAVVKPQHAAKAARQSAVIAVADGEHSGRKGNRAR
jgi:uncharacterized protein YecE (DUF72 family)